MQGAKLQFQQDPNAHFIFDFPFWLRHSPQPLIPGTSPEPCGRPLNWLFLMVNRKRRGAGGREKKKDKSRGGDSGKMKEGDERRKIFHWTPLTQTATAPENLGRFCSRRTFLVFSLCGCHRLNSHLPKKWEWWRASPHRRGTPEEEVCRGLQRKRARGRKWSLPGGAGLSGTQSPAKELPTNTVWISGWDAGSVCPCGRSANKQGLQTRLVGLVRGQAPKQQMSPSAPPGPLRFPPCLGMP